MSKRATKKNFIRVQVFISRENDDYKGKDLLNGKYVLQHKNHAKVRAKISLFATAVSDWNTYIHDIIIVNLS